MVVRENAGQHKGGIKLAADGQQQHLFSLRRGPPDARTSRTTGEPVQPGGFHPAGLDTTKSSAEVNIGHNTDTNKIADRASDAVHGS